MSLSDAIGAVLRENGITGASAGQAHRELLALMRLAVTGQNVRVREELEATKAELRQWQLGIRASTK